MAFDENYVRFLRKHKKVCENLFELAKTTIDNDEKTKLQEKACWLKKYHNLKISNVIVSSDCFDTEDPTVALDELKASLIIR